MKEGFTMIFQDMDRIVFADTSVTDTGSTNPVGEGSFDNFGHDYVRVIENLLPARWNRNGRRLFAQADSTPKAYRGV